MNMIRDILSTALFALAAGLWFFPGDEYWTWVDHLGSYAVISINFMRTAQPFSTLVVLAVATALFMTRKVF